MNPSPAPTLAPDRGTENLRGLTVAVTGANGFLGGAIVAAVRRAHASVRAFVGPPGVFDPTLPADIPALRGEITDIDAVRAIVAGADAVIHAAGPPSVAASFTCAADYARVHTVGTATVLDACRQTGVRRVVYISSAEVYGARSSLPVAEASPLRARSPYGAAKIGAEHLVRAFSCAGYVRATILRPFSLYGPRQPRFSLIATLVRQACEDDRLSLRDLRPVRDYCYVDDAARAVVHACGADQENLIVNVGTGRGTGVAELAALVMRTVGRDVPIVPTTDGIRPGDTEIPCLVADIRRARNVLGWAPRVSLMKGLEETVAWMQTSIGS